MKTTFTIFFRPSSDYNDLKVFSELIELSDTFVSIKIIITIISQKLIILSRFKQLPCFCENCTNVPSALLQFKSNEKKHIIKLYEFGQASEVRTKKANRVTGIWICRFFPFHNFKMENEFYYCNFLYADKKKSQLNRYMIELFTM